MTTAGIVATPVGGGPPPAARQYFSAQGLAEAQNVDESAWTTQVSFLETLDAAADYVAFWSCEITIDTPNVVFPHVEARFTVDGTAIDTISMTGQGAGEWFAQQGMAFLTGAGVGVAMALDFRRSGSDNSPTARCRNGRIFVLRLESGDETADSLASQDNDIITFSDALTLTFTPASAGTYLILGFMQLRPSFSFAAYSRIYDGTNGTPEVGWYSTGGNDRPALLQGWIQPGLSGAQSFKLQYRSDQAAVTTAVIGARLLALRLDGFIHAYHETLNGDAAGGQASYATLLSLTRLVQAGDFLTIVTAFGELSGSGLVDQKVSDPITDLITPIGGQRPSTVQLPISNVSPVALAAGLRTWDLNLRSGSTGTTTLRDNSTITVLRLS